MSWKETAKLLAAKQEIQYPKMVRHDERGRKKKEV